nr:immunoglobulin heavy chain junction region [Mus musculus]MBK4195744.1 immunoglobulin heavy chain junction region [Mus musculus]MBK4195745.1 immunoglobulin heavy chain junction region [Mus musculus]MBK4195746.1 immunoglobulin heavy chain junction region [Mus musculus]MBK4195747.1 immunoglobulin heavy chain junction region [Mus musculus]
CARSPIYYDYAFDYW